MPRDQSLQQHCHLLFGLDKDWEVDEVQLSLEARAVRIRLRHTGSSAIICPGCQNRCSIFDHAPERKWRHLDTIQFETELRARVPRCQCARCGVKTIEVPWAGKHSPFTWMFEAFGVAVLQSAARASPDDEMQLLLPSRGLNHCRVYWPSTPSWELPPIGDIDNVVVAGFGEAVSVVVLIGVADESVGACAPRFHHSPVVSDSSSGNAAPKGIASSAA